MASRAGTADDRRGEIELAERARRGDAEAQSDLVMRLLPHLRSVAHALLGRTADADDAVQIGLMRVLEGLASWRGEAALHQWARKVAANACLRLLEQNRRRSQGVNDETDVEGLVAPSWDGDAVRRSAREYLDRLPAVQRDVVLLRHALGYSVEEIAEITGVAVGTVKSRLLGGRRTLRKLVRRDDTVDALASGVRRAQR